MGGQHPALVTNQGPCISDSCGPASGHRLEDELVVGCAGLVPASVPGMRVSVGLGVSEVSSDPVRDRRPRRESGTRSSVETRVQSRVMITT